MDQWELMRGIRRETSINIDILQIYNRYITETDEHTIFNLAKNKIQDNQKRKEKPFVIK